MSNFIFFDLDGTLTDPGIGITNAVRYALSVYGIEAPDRTALYPFIGPPLVDSFQRYYGFSVEQSYEAVRHFQTYFSSRGIFENKLYPGVPALLADLQSGGRSLVLATSKPEPFALRILEHFSILPYFHTVCGSDLDEKRLATKEAVIAYALEKSGAHPADCVMVGDREYDILGGKAFGMRTVGVLYGYGSRQELEHAGADALCDTVEACREVLLP